MMIDQHILRPAEGNSKPKTQVVLISMPFGPLLQPSIGLGYLKAALTSLNIPTEVLYLTLRFAEIIGAPSYSGIAVNGGAATYDLVGEWIFSSALFDSTDLDAEGYIEDVLRRQAPGNKEARLLSEGYIEDILRIRGEVENFIDECVREIAKRHPTIVGFTSIFQQQIASLALAKRIKAQVPETFIVFGGANCEGVMAAEMVRQFPFIDAVVSGEGDLVFPDLVQRMIADKAITDLQGVYTRDNVGHVGLNGNYPNAPSVRNMDALPIPDYDDFFAQLAASSLDKRYQPRMLFETSRGCWWGEKNHCTFCGLNGMTMTFRSKSADRALEELIYLTNKYPNCPVSVVDNIIDYKYFKDFVPGLAACELDLELFYEVKANLKKEQVRMLRDAGITSIQPGIESLSTEVLTLMRKGVKGLQNIQLLKWCKELGVSAYWNILWGFPRESPEEYTRMAEIVPLITHLAPPRATATIRLDRFSPNFDEADRLGFTNVAPYPAYRYIYPLAPEAVANLAYYFTFDYQQAQDVLSYTKPVLEEVATWREAHETSDLFSIDKTSQLLIWDLRPAALGPLIVLQGLQRVLYIACDTALTTNQLGKLAQEHSGSCTTVKQIEDLLQPLISRGLMIREGNSYLSLAIPLGEYSPQRSVLERFHEILQTLGQTVGDHIIVPVSEDVGKEALLIS